MDTEVTVLLNPKWKSGMGTSIAHGITAIQESGLFDAVLIALTDQPLIDGVFLAKLKKTYQDNPKKIIATGYRNKNGVPAIFGQSYFDALKALHEDHGARHILKEHNHNVISIDAQDSAVDIDTYEAYLYVKKQIKT